MYGLRAELKSAGLSQAERAEIYRKKLGELLGG